jgi:NAD-dependent protein deacetylases, SIR2 family
MNLLESLNGENEISSFYNDATKLKTVQKVINQAEAIVIGAGAGLSTSAGLAYSGKRFKKYFAEFIDKYGMEDMYSAGFYPFNTQEEKWAYWSRHIFYNRYDVEATQVYCKLYEVIRDKNYFVLTTNVDHQFWMAGFEDERIFATQGDYGLFQCAKSCHKKLYDNETEVRAMVSQQKDCKIPQSLVPKCPVCGGEMEVNLRCDGYFVEDERWHQAAERYTSFLEANQNKNLLFLELGVGMNTPGIIKYPFWQMTNQWEKSCYICINKEQPFAPDEIKDRSVCLDRDIGQVLQWIGGNKE